MTAFNRLLIATDFSDGSAQAAAYAAEIAGQFAMQIHVLHVLEPLIIAPVLGDALPPSFPAEREKYAQHELDAWLAATSLTQDDLQSALRYGSPHLEIVKYAQEHAIDIIVLGTHGRTGLAHAVMGSVAERVVRYAKCPVLCVPPKEE